MTIHGEIEFMTAFRSSDGRVEIDFAVKISESDFDVPKVIGSDRLFWNSGNAHFPRPESRGFTISQMHIFVPHLFNNYRKNFVTSSRDQRVI